MHALRITTYVLTSLASLVFLAMVVYGYLAVQDLRNSLQSNPLFGGASSFSAPGAGDTGLDVGDNYANLCSANPGAPECVGG
ncbi:hypothetical protein EV383_0048 [Pseudonocardia sediminis]|uniref:Uncharacterized protein n=1 Tax=Pseudonocardia sediminis TaxID=1397368 RepID=A0A4Q7UTF0_PSEST|nr:hypothetical protein [Pseudonocardia sediminis]RZT83249.1 hypothetical protein EV383_0048 [Pseudonocardia sediminis]